MTKQEQLIAALETLGYERVPDQKTRKYVVFRDPTAVKDTLFYVGKQGAVRIGGPLSNTFGVSDKWKREVIRQAAVRRELDGTVPVAPNT